MDSGLRYFSIGQVETPVLSSFHSECSAMNFSWDSLIFLTEGYLSLSSLT